METLETRPVEYFNPEVMAYSFSVKENENGVKPDKKERPRLRGVFHLWVKKVDESGTEYIYGLIEKEDGVMVHIEDTSIKFVGKLAHF